MNPASGERASSIRSSWLLFSALALRNVAIVALAMRLIIKFLADYTAGWIFFTFTGWAWLLGSLAVPAIAADLLTRSATRRYPGDASPSNVQVVTVVLTLVISLLAALVSLRF